MGLILARFIILSHGGALTVESRHGAGSTFTMFLPLLFPE
jgi:signal transduction histidine kinase